MSFHRDRLEEIRRECIYQISALDKENHRLKAENEALRKDAERYRWLRQKQLSLDGHDFLSTQEILDRRVDAAMAKESK